MKIEGKMSPFSISGFSFFSGKCGFCGCVWLIRGVSGRSFPGKCGFCGCVWLIRGVSGRYFPGKCGFCGCVWLIRGVSGRYFPGECVSFCVFGGSGIVLRGSVGGKCRQSFRCAKIFVSFLFSSDCRDFGVYNGGIAGLTFFGS